jgi:hypothetical protein
MSIKMKNYLLLLGELPSDMKSCVESVDITLFSFAGAVEPRA